MRILRGKHEGYPVFSTPFLNALRLNGKRSDVTWVLFPSSRADRAAEHPVRPLRRMSLNCDGILSDVWCGRSALTIALKTWLSWAWAFSSRLGRSSNPLAL